MAALSAWRSLKVAPREMSLRNTFKNGQCWCWNEVSGGEEDESMWCGVVGGAVYLLKQQPNDVLFQVLEAPPQQPQPQRPPRQEESLRRFLQLDTHMEPLKQRWTSGSQKVHQDMRTIVDSLPGMRVLRQDPLECLFSFMASANNNITRIGHILMYWRVKWGTHVLTTNATHDRIYTVENDPTYQEDIQKYVARYSHYQAKGQPLVDTSMEELSLRNKVHYFTFPSLNKLLTLNLSDFQAKDTGCGLGYRAQTTLQTVQLLHQLGGRDYLMQLRSEQDPHVVSTTLQQFAGVGPKVADCVSLFSLDQPSIVPADTHVVDIAERDFGTTALYTACTSKSLTPTKRKMINNCFVSAFGSYAGWAHCLLFAAELPVFEDCLPQALVKENGVFKEMKKQRSKVLKEEQRRRKKKKKEEEEESGKGEESPEKKRKIGNHSYSTPKSTTSKYFKK